MRDEGSVGIVRRMKGERKERVNGGREGGNNGKRMRKRVKEEGKEGAEERRECKMKKGNECGSIGVSKMEGKGRKKSDGFDGKKKDI